MEKKVIPIYQMGEHCKEVKIDTIKVSSFQEQRCTATEFLEHHRHDYYEIIWLKKGTGIHWIDTIAYPYSGSFLFLLSPGQIHKLEQYEKSEGYVIKFLPTIFRDQKDIDDFIFNASLFDNIQASPLIKVPAPQHALLEDILQKIEIEFNSNEIDKDHILSAYLKIFMTSILRIKRSNDISNESRIDPHYFLFTQYKIVIERNFRTTHAVHTFADQLNTQARTLTLVSKKYAGKSASQLISDRIILEAKRSLHFEHESVKELAYNLGFEDPAYFTRFFKKHTGISPFQFKSGFTDQKPTRQIA